MAIQMRRGLRADFDPYKMLPGEWAVSIDPSTSNQIVWMCFEPGVCKRMGTYEDFAEQVKEATADVKTEYVEEFDKILDEIKVLSSQVSDDKDAVVSIKTTIEDEYLPQIQEALLEIQEKVSEAKNSADAAAVSAENAKKSEVNAKNSETEAKTSETNAATSESNAKISETNAATSATTATAKATDAANYASNAETSALTATNKAIEASQYAEEAAESAKQSQISADAAAVSEANAKTSEANAKTYAEQAKEVSALEVMTEENNGIGKPDGDTITVDENGTFKAIKAEQDGNGKVISDTYATKTEMSAVNTKLINKRILRGTATAAYSSGWNITVNYLDYSHITAYEPQNGDILIIDIAYQSRNATSAYSNYLYVGDNSYPIYKFNYNTNASVSPVGLNLCEKRVMIIKFQLNKDTMIACPVDYDASFSSTFKSLDGIGTLFTQSGAYNLYNDTLHLVDTGSVDAHEAAETNSVCLSYEKPVILIIWGYVSTETYNGKLYGYGAYLRVLHGYQTSADSEQTDQIGGMTLAVSTNVPYTLSNDAKNGCVNIKATKGYFVHYSVYEVYQ